MPKHTITSPTQPRLKRQTTTTAAVELNETPQQQFLENDQSYVKTQKEIGLATSSTWFYIGQCALTFELYSLAVQAFDSSLRHVPDNAESLIGLSKSLKLQDPTIGLKQSTELLLTSIQRYGHLSNEPLLWKELCETHLDSNQYEEAHQAISRALTINGNDPELLLVGAECLTKLSNFQYATHTLHSVLSVFANQPHLSEHEVDIVREAHYKLAYLASLENNLKFAISEMQTALSLPPQSPSKVEKQATLWAFLITLKERSGDIDGAMKTSQEAINSLGSIPKLLIAKAYILLLPHTKCFDPVLAITLLGSAINQEILTHGPNADGDFLIWYLLGKAHSAVDSPREAYDAFQIALRIGPSSPFPWLAVGSLYLKTGQLPDALAAYSQAARLLVDETSVSSAVASATAWDGLSCVYERCDDQAHDAADACLRAAACFRAAGDLRAASQSEQRAHSLTAGARGEAPVPSLRGPPETPIVLLRDLIVSGSKTSVKADSTQAPVQSQTVQATIQNTNNSPPQRRPPSQGPVSSHKPSQSSTVSRQLESPKQFHHIPIPRGSLASRAGTPDNKASVSQPPQNRQQHPGWSPQNEQAQNGYYYHQGPLPNSTNSRSIIVSNGNSQPSGPNFQNPQQPPIQPPQAQVYPIPDGASYLPPQNYAYANGPQAPTSNGYASWR
jgi:tetratricopeptide (TPR) repeat protein